MLASADDAARAKLRNNPLLVIGLACCVAAAMSIVAFFVYYRSPTREIVEQIQRNNTAFEQQATPADTALLSQEYLDRSEAKIRKVLGDHNDKADFSASALTDESLGL